MNQVEREQLHQAMVRLADGDRSAFDPVFVTIWPILRRFALRVMVSPADAEDAAQAALEKVLQRASEFDPSRDALAWVLGIAAYECRTLRQKHRRRKEEPSSLDELEPVLAGDGAPSPEDRVIARDLDAAVLEVLGTLRANDAETLQLLLADERLEGATFRKRVERAMRRLREAWRAKHGTD
ncbi:MAG: sigma-70 family RNA polymerase sigma factor [Polyangiaceae bacterium]|nr:sigma-70 family RNA polymerase sigma factor [Polyangiaceae bacterium]